MKLNPGKSKLLIILFFTVIQAQAQVDKYWYFGNGTDGLIFNSSGPVKVSNKYSGVGYEGVTVICDPNTGDMLFYSDGILVINKNHAVMINGTGLTGHWSGAQCVQSCPVPGSCLKQFYLFTNSAYDNTSGAISYSMVDFTSNPNGTIISKNTSFWAGPSDQGMCLIRKPYTNDYWLIANSFLTATYNVWAITAAGFSPPVSYTFSNTGSSYQICYSETAQKIVVTGLNSKRVTAIDFNPVSGMLSNEVQLAPLSFGNCFGARFSLDATKLYVSNSQSTFQQYDFNTGNWTNLNTCCYAHDARMGPDGKMYMIHTYNSNQPIGVVDFPDSTAIGNACNYHTLSFVPSFNGAVRRFPEFLIYPEMPVGVPDTISVNAGAGSILNVLSNDYDPQGDSLFVDSILYGPFFGTASVVNGLISYTADTTHCGDTDTIMYLLSDINCYKVICTVYIPITCNLFPTALMTSSDTLFCEKACIDFYDFSTNSPTSWQWYFPGGVPATSNLQHPTGICYNSFGSFDVTLVVCNSFGCDSLVLPGFINEVTPPPAPVITANYDTLFSTPAFSYQWYNASGIIPGATGSYYIYQQPGSYYVIITDTNGCASSSTIISTGIDDPAGNLLQLQIIPNPNNGYFEILSPELQGEKQLMICDMTGRSVYSEMLMPPSSRCRVNLNKFADGVYFVSIISGTRSWHRKMMIQRK